MGSEPLLTVAEAKNGGVFASISAIRSVIVMKGSDPIKSTATVKGSSPKGLTPF